MSKPKSTDEPEYVFLVQNANRIQGLSWYEKRTDGPTGHTTAVIDDPVTGEKRVAIIERRDEGRLLEARTQLLLPGLNAIPADVLSRCGGIEAATALDVRAEDPTTIGVFYACELAKRTASRHALRAWQARETREDVLAAIEKRLNRETHEPSRDGTDRTLATANARNIAKMEADRA